MVHSAEGILQAAILTVPGVISAKSYQYLLFGPPPPRYPPVIPSIGQHPPYQWCGFSSANPPP